MKKLFAWALLFVMLLSVAALAALPPEGFEPDAFGEPDTCTCPTANHINLQEAGHQRLCSNCGNGIYNHVVAVPTCISSARCVKFGCNFIDMSSPALGHLPADGYTAINETSHGIICTRAGCGTYTDVRNHVWESTPSYFGEVPYKRCFVCHHLYPWD